MSRLLYLDTSALLRLYTAEPDHEQVREAVAQATGVVCHQITYVGAPSGKLRLLAKGLNKRAKADLAAHAHALACLSEGMFRSVLDVPGTDTASPG